MTYGARPFGLREVELTPLPTGSQVQLPVSTLLAGAIRAKTAELVGDDSIVAVCAAAEALEWKMEAGGITLAAHAVLTGSTLYTSGTTPNRVRSLTITAGQCFPYFSIYGRAVGEDCTSDAHHLIWKAKVTKLEGDLKGGDFYVTKCEGIAVDDQVHGIITYVQHETGQALPAS